MRPYQCLAFSALLCLVLTPPAGANDSAPLPAPSLVVESAGAPHQIWVELPGEAGAPQRHLLRETQAAVTPGPTGRDPSGRAAFADWTEGPNETWSSFSRDGGKTWSKARRLFTDLRLRAGSVPPGAALPRPAAGLALPSSGKIFLVQFRTVSLPEWRAALEATGAHVLRYFPYNAHLVWMEPGLVPRIASLSFVERVEPYHPSYRLEPALVKWIESTDGPAAGPSEMRVRAVSFQWGPTGKARIAEAAEALGARVAQYWPSGNVLELWVNRDQLRALAANDEVMWVDRWSPPETDMDLVREDAGDNWIENNFGYCGQGVHGEVMDAGIQSNHPDFDGILMHTAASVSSHGTSTYGIVFGNGDRDGDGQAKGTGHMPCPEAQGIFADYDNVSDRFAHTEELKHSPYFASFQTNSWGNARTTSYNSYSFEMDDIIWRLDIAITQSQSNAGNRSSRPQAWAKNIISVGGVYHYDTLDTSDDRWNSGASIGPAEDGRIKPDLCYWYDDIYTTTSGNGYTSTFGGTSAATPETAGALGLTVQMWSDNVWGTNPTGNTVFERQPHFATIKALLINNARQYPFTGTSSDLTRMHQGWGRPNVQTAKERADRSLVVDQNEVLTVGQTSTFDVNVASGESELKVTMSYPDPPGTTSASLHRINDLDLTVTSPSATVYHGNVGLDAGDYSTPGGSPNSVDTVENVFVENPEAGTWTVEVQAVEVNQDAYLDTPADDVTYALVVTGGTAGGVCGNGKLEYGEECDGSDLGGATCESEGCSGGGALGCNSDCTYDLSGCSDCPVCGDGNCDFGEDCLTCGGDCISESSAACGNGLCEAADGEDCVSCPADCASVQTGKPSGRYCCGAGGGTNPVPCTDSRCVSGGFACSDQPSLAYCCGDGTCEGAEDIPSCAIDCTPPSPGETTSLLVTGYDRVADLLSISYGTACAATDNTIEYGLLTRADLSSYNWSGQQCNIGNTGSYDWASPGGTDSIFFVVVAHDASKSGSYGTDSNGTERPEDNTNLDCPVPQDLTYRCD